MSSATVRVRILVPGLARLGHPALGRDPRVGDLPILPRAVADCLVDLGAAEHLRPVRVRALECVLVAEAGRLLAGDVVDLPEPLADDLVARGLVARASGAALHRTPRPEGSDLV